MEDGRTILTNYGSAERHSRDMLHDAQNALGDASLPQIDEPLNPSSDLIKYFFSLQGTIEKSGDMDYHEYGRRMWGELMGEPATEEDEKAVSLFENSMIVGLHQIPMEEMVYPHVVDQLEALIDVRNDRVKEVALWSTGDVAATGYQSAKIESSGIIGKFMDIVKKRGDAREFMRKTRYMVADDKVERLVTHVAGLIEAGEENPKLVIIEDSRGNFGKVRQALKEKFGEERADRIKIEPIWAAYSREGQEAEKNLTWEEYMKSRKDFNAIDSFIELLDPRFNETFADAHVFVDFDGVIGDNIRMRQAQATTINKALVTAGVMSGLTVEEVNQRIDENLQKRSQ